MFFVFLSGGSIQQFVLNHLCSKMQVKMARTHCLLILVSITLILKYASGNAEQTSTGHGPDIESRLRELEAQVQSLQRDMQLLKGTESTRLLRTSLRSSEPQAAEVGFHVNLEVTKTFQKDETVKFDKAVTRIGNAYDMDSGVFTCIQEGTYLFSLSIVSDQYNYVEAAIMKNGAAILDVVGDSHAGTTRSQGSGTTIVHLRKGDKVCVNIIHLASGLEGTLYGSGLSSFSGYLLKPQLIS